MMVDETLWRHMVKDELGNLNPSGGGKWNDLNPFHKVFSGNNDELVAIK